MRVTGLRQDGSNSAAQVTRVRINRQVIGVFTGITRLPVGTAGAVGQTGFTLSRGSIGGVVFTGRAADRTSALRNIKYLPRNTLGTQGGLGAVLAIRQAVCALIRVGVEAVRASLEAKICILGQIITTFLIRRDILGTCGTARLVRAHIAIVEAETTLGDRTNRAKFPGRARGIARATIGRNNITRCTTKANRLAVTFVTAGKTFFALVSAWILTDLAKLSGPTRVHTGVSSGVQNLALNALGARIACALTTITDSARRTLIRALGADIVAISTFDYALIAITKIVR